MLQISYFATETGYVIEVLDGDILIDDVRVTESGVPQALLATYAKLNAAELADKHKVPFDAIVYDHIGQRDEECLFG